MKSKQLKIKKEGLLAEMDELAAKAKMSDEEKDHWTELKGQVEALDREIKIAEEQEDFLRMRASGSGRDISNKEEADLRQYSFVKAINEILKNGKLSGLEAEMDTEGRAEIAKLGQEISSFTIPSRILKMGDPRYAKRADITTSTAPLVPTNLVGFIDALYAKLFATRLGATFMTGLTGNISIPRVATAASAGWATEVADAADAGSDTDNVSITPKRLACYQDLSKLLISQSPYNVEDMVRNLFLQAMQIALEAAIIEGATNGPTGILNESGIGDVAGGTNGLAPTLAHMLALQREVAIDNADIGNLAYVCSPLARWKLQSTAIESGHPERVWNVLQPNNLLGYNAAVTTLAPDDLNKGSSTGVCSAIIFGNWSELVVAGFGGIDVLVDPYTVGIGNKVRIVLNSFWDAVLKHVESMAAMQDALCSS